MKPIEEVVCCVVDYGKFILVAEAMARKCKQTYYHSPFDREFQDLSDCAKGDGIDGVDRLDDFLDPERIKEIDLFIFPDIGFRAEQKLLRSMGKAVWGAMGMNDLELNRTQFIDFVREIGLPMVASKKIRGLTALREHLKEQNGKWIKLNRYRAIMETWHHQDYEHSLQKLDSLAIRLGGLQEWAVFVVQDEIDADIEIGYDGWTVDGQFPSASFQGYELKNELYLGSVLAKEDLPEPVIAVNEAMADKLKEYGYRNFIATEIRVLDEKPYFIDPTLRCPGLTGDHFGYSCSNLPEVIWQGANGELIEPEFEAQFAAVATMHYQNHVPHEMFCLRIPEAVRECVKLYHYCYANGLYHFLPSVPYECNEAGVVIGLGDSVEESIEALKENFEQLKDEPLSIETAGFVELIYQIGDAEKEGVEFSDQPVPAPETALQ